MTLREPRFGGVSFSSERLLLADSCRSILAIFHDLNVRYWLEETFRLGLSKSVFGMSGIRPKADIGLNSVGKAATDPKQSFRNI